VWDWCGLALSLIASATSLLPALRSAKIKRLTTSDLCR
jgi:hypothetical protein